MFFVLNFIRNNLNKFLYKFVGIHIGSFSMIIIVTSIRVALIMGTGTDFLEGVLGEINSPEFVNVTSKGKLPFEWVDEPVDLTVKEGKTNVVVNPTTIFYGLFFPSVLVISSIIVLFFS